MGVGVTWEKGQRGRCRGGEGRYASMDNGKDVGVGVKASRRVLGVKDVESRVQSAYHRHRP